MKKSQPPGQYTDLRFVWFVLFLVLVLCSSRTYAQDLVVTAPLTISNDVTYENVIVQSGGTLTLNAALTVNEKMAVESGGVVTHSLRFEPGLEISVGDTLHIQSGGFINLNSCGLRGGNNGSVFGRIGEAYDTGGNIVSGAQTSTAAGAGASYGGRGATGSTPGVQPNQPYGQLESASRLGSGGGAAKVSGARGGHGGGRATINAGILVIDGEILANGGIGSTSSGQSGGGGSGGSLKLQVGMLSGSGIIQAIGGQGRTSYSSNIGGSGGGGRIVIQYTDSTFPEANIFANGVYATTASANWAGTAGTIYLEDTDDPAGTLIYDNNNVSSILESSILTSLTTLKSLVLRNYGKLGVLATDLAVISVMDPISLTGASGLTLNSGVMVEVNNESGYDLSIEGASTVTLDAGSSLSLNAIEISGGTMNTSIDFSFPLGTDFHLTSAGKLNVLNGATFGIENFNAVNIESGDLFVSDGSILNVMSGEITIGSGVLLIKDGRFGELDRIDNLTITGGGAIRHSDRNENGLFLDVVNNMTINASGLIDLNQRGLRGGNNGSIFGGYGEAYDSDGNIVSGAQGVLDAGAGASYGGWGATGSTAGVLPNPPYGQFEVANLLGSGGGGAAASDVRGGHGGGRATINAGALVVDGEILANGGIGTTAGGRSGGGGSGGSLHFQVGTLSGSGVIQAMGGQGRTSFSSNIGGSGGGGRIVIQYTDSTFPVANILASGVYATTVSANWAGSAGTIYLDDTEESMGTLIYDNGNVSSILESSILTSLTTLKSLVLRNYGKLGVLATDLAVFTVMDPISLTGASVLELNDGVSVDVLGSAGFDMNIESNSTLILGDGSELVVDAIRADAGVFQCLTEYQIATILIENGGLLDVQAPLTVTDQLTVETNGEVEVGSDLIFIGQVFATSGGVFRH